MQSLFLDDRTHDIQKKVNIKLNEFAEDYSRRYNIQIDSLVAKGRVYHQINEVSKMIDANLIVMGTNGSPKGAIRKFIGSNDFFLNPNFSCSVPIFHLVFSLHP